MYEELYQENKGLIWLTACHYRGQCVKNRAVSVEDLVQVGFLGLVKAFESYDGRNGRSWIFHLRHALIQEMRAALGMHDGTRVDPHVGAVSMDVALCPDDADSATMADMIVDESLPEADETLLREEIRENVCRAIEKLTDPRQRQVVELFAIEGRPLNEVAEAMEIPTLRVRQIYFRALATLRRDERLRGLVDLDERTRFHAHKGVRAFMSDNTSVTEGAAIWRIEQGENRKI